MNLSIRKQLTIIFIGLTAALFMANYLINTFFLEDFYSMRKQEVLVQAYEQLNTNITDQGTMDQDKIQDIEDLCNANNVSFIVTDQNYNMVIWTASDNAASDYARLMRARLNGYGIGLDVIDDDSILQKNDNYTIQKKFDQAVATDYLEMWGTLDKGYYFIMRINMESIRDSVRISNEFIAYICIIGVFFAGVLVWFISKRVTRPLNELTELSKRMAELDFDAKYTSGGKNEVGQLGEHFNQMSENLEKAYSQLMTANNELKKDIEKKERIDDMRKEFLSNVSHELKTPIALIQGYAEGLQECVNDDEESRAFYCEVIMDEAGKMNAMVQKLLTLNQLEFGNDQVVMERFDLAVLIRNKLQSVTILAQQKNVELAFHGPEVLPVWGDEFKVEEVLTNYLSNALNHVSGELRITVTAELCGETVRVTVHNTGAPIPEEDLGLIWDKFYKVDKARTREYGGSGVGLSIVKAIMESFHQQYGVRNCEDGVAFWFELKSGGSAGI
jgi:signal transduction histidine kinase